MFFPERGGPDVNKAAIAVCQDCQVRTECLAYAIAEHENAGVWGGLTARQRRNQRHHDLRLKEKAS